VKLTKHITGVNVLWKQKKKDGKDLIKPRKELDYAYVLKLKNKDRED